MRKHAKMLFAAAWMLAGIGLGTILICLNGTEAEPEKKTVGFISTRNEDTFGDLLDEILKESLQESGYHLLDVSTDNTQQAQEEAIRLLLAASVDVIVFSPVCESGWDELLKEAQRLRIPIVTVLETLNNQDLCAVYEVAGDYSQQAGQMMEYLASVVEEPAKVFVLSGTISSSMTQKLTNGLQRFQSDILSVNNRAYGNFMRSRGREIIRGIFRHNNEIDVIIAHNEAMGMGAVDALEELGIKPGEVHVCFFGGNLEETAWRESGYISCAWLYDVPALAKGVLEAVDTASPEAAGSHKWTAPGLLLTKEDAE